MEPEAACRCGRDRCHSGGFLLRNMPPSWHPVPACTPRLCCRRAILYSHDDCAASIRKSEPEIKNRCTKEGLNREKLASIPKFGLEIKNRCTKEGENGEKLTSIPKFGPEIKNRCTQKVVFGEILASIPKSGPEIKNRCTKEGLNREKLASIPKSEPEMKNRCSPGLRRRNHFPLQQRKLVSDAERCCNAA